MIDRRPEPPPSDPQAEAEAYDAMDHTDVNREFVADCIAAGPIGTRVVELGSGPAAIAIELARQSPEVEITAIDPDPAMLEIARRAVEQSGLSDRIAMVRMDATQPWPDQSGRFDTVISNSVLHHVDRPAAMLRLAANLIRPTGRVFIRDLARPTSAAAIEKLVDLHAAGEPPVARQLLRQSLWAAWTVDEVESFWATATGVGSRGGIVQMTSDRHWTLDWQPR